MWQQAVIVAVVPVLVNLLKGWLGSRTYLIPPLALVLAGIGNAASSYATGTPVSHSTGLALGLAAVGLREFVDQIQKANAPAVK